MFKKVQKNWLRHILWIFLKIYVRKFKNVQKHTKFWNLKWILEDWSGSDLQHFKKNEQFWTFHKKNWIRILQFCKNDFLANPGKITKKKGFFYFFRNKDLDFLNLCFLKVAYLYLVVRLAFSVSRWTKVGLLKRCTKHDFFHNETSTLAPFVIVYILDHL
jgi:hypothetical protein